MQVLAKKKPQKMSPKWTKTQTRDQHPKGPFGSFGVPIVTFEVPIGIKGGPGLRALGLR